MLQQPVERVPVAVDIDQYDWFVMQSELFPSDDFKSFVERAKPEIVESFQGKLEAARTLRDTLRASRDRLTGGAA